MYKLTYRWQNPFLWLAILISAAGSTLPGHFYQNSAVQLQMAIWILAAGCFGLSLVPQAFYKATLVQRAKIGMTILAMMGIYLALGNAFSGDGLWIIDDGIIRVNLIQLGFAVLGGILTCCMLYATRQEESASALRDTAPRTAGGGEDVPAKQAAEPVAAPQAGEHSVPEIKAARQIESVSAESNENLAIELAAPAALAPEPAKPSAGPTPSAVKSVSSVTPAAPAAKSQGSSKSEGSSGPSGETPLKQITRESRIPVTSTVTGLKAMSSGLGHSGLGARAAASGSSTNLKGLLDKLDPDIKLTEGGEAPAAPVAEAKPAADAKPATPSGAAKPAAKATSGTPTSPLSSPASATNTDADKAQTPSVVSRQPGAQASTPAVSGSAPSPVASAAAAGAPPAVTSVNAASGAATGEAELKKPPASTTATRLQAQKRKSTATFTKLQALSAGGNAGASAASRPKQTDIDPESDSLKSILDRLDTQQYDDEPDILSPSERLFSLPEALAGNELDALVSGEARHHEKSAAEERAELTNITAHTEPVSGTAASEKPIDLEITLEPSLPENLQAANREKVEEVKSESLPVNNEDAVSEVAPKADAAMSDLAEASKHDAALAKGGNPDTEPNLSNMLDGMDPLLPDTTDFSPPPGGETSMTSGPQSGYSQDDLLSIKTPKQKPGLRELASKEANKSKSTLIGRSKSEGDAAKSKPDSEKSPESEAEPSAKTSDSEEPTNAVSDQEKAAQESIEAALAAAFAPEPMSEEESSLISDAANILSSSNQAPKAEGLIESVQEKIEPEAEAKAEPAEPKSEAAESMSLEAKTELAEGKSETEPVEAKTGSEETKAEPAEAKAESAESQSEPVEATSEAAEAKSEAVEATSNATESKSEPAEATSEAAEATSEAVEPTSEATESKSEATESQSEATESQSEATESQSEATESKAEPAEAKSESADAKSEATESKSEAAEATSEAAESKAEPAEAKSEAAEATSEAAESKAEHAEAKSEAAEAKSEATESKSEPAEAKSEAAEPKSEAVEAKSEATESKSEPAEAKSEAVEPTSEPAEAKSEATESKSEAAESKSEAAESKSEAAEAKSEAVEPKSEATESKSEPAEAKSEAVESTSEAADAKSEAADAKSEAAESQSEPVEATSEATESKSEAAESQSEPVEATSEATESKSEAAESQSEPVEATSEATESKSEAAESQSEPVEATSEATESQPEAAESQSEPVEATSEATESKSEAAESQSEPVEATSEATESKSEAAESQSEPVEATSEATESKFEAAESQSEPVEATSEATESKSEAAESQSEPVEATSEATESKSEAVEPKSEATESKSEPATVEAEASPEVQPEAESSNLFGTKVDQDIDAIFSAIAPPEAQREVSFAAKVEEDLAKGEQEQPSPLSESFIELEPSDSAKDNVFGQTIDKDIDDIFSSIVPPEAQKEVTEATYQKSQAVPAQQAADEEQAPVSSPPPSVVTPNTVPASPTESVEIAATTDSDLASLRAAQEDTIPPADPEPSDKLFQPHAVDKELDDIFSAIAPQEALKNVSSETLKKLKPAEPSEMSFAPPETAPVQATPPPAQPPAQPPKAVKFNETLARLPSMQGTVEGLLNNLAEMASDSDFKSEPKGAGSEKTGAGSIESPTKAATNSAQNIIDSLEQANKENADDQPQTAAASAQSSIQPGSIQAAAASAQSSIQPGSIQAAAADRAASSKAEPVEALQPESLSESADEAIDAALKAAEGSKQGDALAQKAPQPAASAEPQTTEQQLEEIEGELQDGDVPLSMRATVDIATALRDAQKAKQLAAVEKQLKEFGRLSSKAPAPAAETGSMKTIGKLLIEVGQIENIIKQGETGKVGGNLSTARVISAQRGAGIQDLLSKIDSFSGVTGCIIIGHDGLVISSTVNSEMDKDTLGNLSLALVGTTNLATLKLEIGKLRQMVMITDRNITVLTDVDVGILAVFMKDVCIDKVDGLIDSIHQTIHG